jgi:hypothetical protein
MALIWIYDHKKKASVAATWRWKETSLFLLTLLLFSYLEEGLWDIFIWKDHTGPFPFLLDLPQPDLWVISILVPLLSLP